MESFVVNAQLAPIERSLKGLKGAARLPLTVTLAWHLRQRDWRRALLLVEEAEGLQAQASLFAADQQSLIARLHLIRGEIFWLKAELDPAEASMQHALGLFETLQDPLGLADTLWLASVIALDRGEMALCTTHLESLIDLTRTLDPVRTGIAEGALARAAVYQDLQTGSARWRQYFDLADVHPAAGTWILDYLGAQAFQANEFGHAATYWMQAFELALQTGQLRRAIVATTNIGSCFDSLSDFDTGLNWMQQGLDLARPTGWPSALGLCLIQTADTMRCLGNFSASEELLSEALSTLSQLTGSRAYAMALAYLADLALATQQFERALQTFDELEIRGRALQQFDFSIESARGRAHALSRLGRPEEALAAAHLAFDLAAEQGSSYRRISALEVLAQIHLRHPLPAPDGIAEASASLHYLQRALDQAASIDGYHVSGDLLDALAEAYAAVDDYSEAYRTSLQANAARNKTHSLEATNRATALQVTFRTERAQSEAEHLRQLAAAEAQRAEVMQQTSVTLERLGAIGQEITAHLNASAVFETLDRHVHLLLDATFFAIYLISPDGSMLEMAFGVEDGKSLAPHSVAVNDPAATSARCVRERREMLIDIAEDEDYTKHLGRLIPGTLPTLSLLFAPLIVGDRVLGVMSMQSWQRFAYGDRELLIFRSLCAYGAIALDNAGAYRQLTATLKKLRETQGQLLDKNVELEEAYRTLEEVSLTDPLTGLHNRRFLLQHVESDVALSLRHYEDFLDAHGAAAGHGAVPADSDVVFFVLDFDQFKAVNDQYGHAAGDMVLVQMAARLRHLFRESDYLIRWGGEEFLIVARATNRADAEAVAERMRAAVADQPFELADGTQLTKSCSIGFASYPFFPQQPRLLSWSQVLELADQSLYMAKNGGRNQWIGLYGLECKQADGVFQRLMRQTVKAVQQGELRLVSSTH